MKYALIQTDDGFKFLGAYPDIESAEKARDRQFGGTYIIVQVF